MAEATPIVRNFGQAHGREIREVMLRSADGGIEGSVIELGAAVRDVQVRRADGCLQRVVLGLNSAADYAAHSPHMGAIAGRFGNRIRGGRFVLDGVPYQLALNENGRTALHGGGATGFGKTAWSLLHADGASATLALHSPDGDNGYPGAMTVTCRITLAPPRTLRIELWATSDQPTIVNLCHHSYFNLDGSADILDHALTIAADVYAPVDVALIPSGALELVADTPLDFRSQRRLRAPSMVPARLGIDNTFILRRQELSALGASGYRLAHAATLSSHQSGLAMACWTTEPALQVYDGHKLAVPVAGLGGVIYGACAGLALEPQHVPDSPNLPQFPSTVLRPGQVYRQITEYRFQHI